VTGSAYFNDWADPSEWQSSPGVRFVETRTAGTIVARVHLAPGAELKAHSHPEEQIFYVLDGRLRYRVGDEEQVAGRGMLIVIPSGVPHWGRAEGDSDAVFLELKQRLSP
jgi:quercetin dioxygenase-like cupin family protein